MKNLFNSGILIVCLLIGTSICRAQEFENTKENEYMVRKELNSGMISFTNSVSVYYKKGMSYEELIKTLIGENSTTEMPNEGQVLLEKAYEYLSKGYDAEQIARSSSGQETAAAALFVNNYNLENDNSLGNQALFGILPFSPSEDDYQKSAKKCRWWQLSCHLKEIFGEEGGNTIMAAIIKILVGLLKG